MPGLTRRTWLEQATLLGVFSSGLGFSRARAQGLDRFMVPASAPCTTKPVLTPAADVGAGFRTGAPLRRNVVDAGAPGSPMVLSGTVIGLTCGRIKGARVDVWQADARGLSGEDIRGARAHQITDAEGRYEFVTVVPGSQPDRAPRLNLRVDVPASSAPARGRSRTLTTALFFPSDPRNAKDPVFKPELVLKPAPPASGLTAYVFDIILDL